MKAKTKARNMKWAKVKRERGIQKSGVKVNGKFKYRLRFSKVVMGADGSPVLTKDGNAKREYKYKVFDSFDAAQKAKAAEETKFRNDHDEDKKAIDPSKVTFAQLANAFMPKLHEVRYDNAPNPDDRHKVSGTKGWKDERRNMEMFVEHFGSKLINTITSDDIEELRDLRLATPKLRGGGKRSRANVNRELATLSKAFSFAIRQRPQWMTSNPVHDEKRIIDQRKEAKRERVLDWAEEKRLLDACNALGFDYLRSLLLFLLHTSTRIGDAMKLERRDIDLNEGTLGLIVIRRLTTRPSGEVLTTKTNKTRKIPILHPELREVIDQRLAAIDDDPQALLFPKPYSSFRKQFAKAKTLAKITDFHFHDLRHTWVTRGGQSGIDPVAAMAISGHDKVETFMGYNNKTTEMNNANAQKYQEYIEANRIQVANAHVN
jgi:integrase